MPKITKRIVDAAAPVPGRRYYVWDAEIKGFGVLILPSGVKTYFFRYRNAEGVERRAFIGKHGAWTPDEARREADELRRAVVAGRDPLADRTEQRNAPMVGDMLRAYLASDRFKTKAPSTQSIDRGRVERHLIPTLGRKLVHAVTPGDVERAFRAITDGKTAADVKTGARGRARVVGGEGTARMAVRLLSAAFGWAIQERLAKTNPCEHVKTGSDGSRNLILEDAGEYRRLFVAIDKLESEGRVRAPVADAIRLIALTGARRGEITGLRWEHVDLRRGLLTLPPKSHKTGRRTGKPRLIGLPSAAQAIISRQPAGEPGDLVFPPSAGAGPLSLAKPWRVIRAEAALPREIGLHGLRHSLASHMAMDGAEAAEIMTALGHGQLSTAQKYVHWAQDARQGLAERAAAVALAGMRAEPDGSVVALRRGAR